jgi:Flp pilus assembly pilin Flp
VLRVDNNTDIGNGKEHGATMVEYAVMVALIALAIIAAVRLLGTALSNQFVAAGSQIN